MNAQERPNQCIAQTKEQRRCKRSGDPYCFQHAAGSMSKTMDAADLPASDIPRAEAGSNLTGSYIELSKSAAGSMQALNTADWAKTLAGSIQALNTADWAKTLAGSVDTADWAKTLAGSVDTADWAKTLAGSVDTAWAKTLAGSVDTAGWAKTLAGSMQALADVGWSKSIAASLRARIDDAWPEIDPGVWERAFLRWDRSVGLSVLEAEWAQADGPDELPDNPVEYAAGVVAATRPVSLEGSHADAENGPRLVDALLVTLMFWMVVQSSPELQALFGFLGFPITFAPLIWGALKKQDKN